MHHSRKQFPYWCLQVMHNYIVNFIIIFTSKQNQVSLTYNYKMSGQHNIRVWWTGRSETTLFRKNHLILKVPDVCFRIVFINVPTTISTTAIQLQNNWFNYDSLGCNRPVSSVKGRRQPVLTSVTIIAVILFFSYNDDFLGY